MKLKTHAKVGALVGGTIGGVYALKTMPADYSPIKKILYLLSWMLACGYIGCISSILPDIIEPAISPHHRKIFHSILALIVSAGVTIESKNPLLKSFAGGYGSHLGLDATTPMELPII